MPRACACGGTRNGPGRSQSSDVLFLAIPFLAVQPFAASQPRWHGKIIVDAAERETPWNYAISSNALRRPTSEQASAPKRLSSPAPAKGPIQARHWNPRQPNHRPGAPSATPSRCRHTRGRICTSTSPPAKNTCCHRHHVHNRRSIRHSGSVHNACSVLLERTGPKGLLQSRTADSGRQAAGRWAAERDVRPGAGAAVPRRSCSAPRAGTPGRQVTRHCR